MKKPAINSAFRETPNDTIRAAESFERPLSQRIVNPGKPGLRPVLETSKLCS